jgi:hypothetical protein
MMDRTRCTGNGVGQSPGGAESSLLLTSPPFTMAVALLLLNDWVLKAAIGNGLTGKLSDFAGLFAFSLFWTAILPRHRDVVFLLTAAGFTVWKSPLSDAPLAAWNALGVWPLARVIDYTDWAAVTALLPAYWMARRCAARMAIPAPPLPRRVAAVGVAALSLIAFTATSVPAPRYQLHDPTGYRVSASQQQVRAGLTSIGLYVVGATTIDPVDRLLVYIRQPPERVLAVSVEIRKTDSLETVIRMLDVSTSGPEPRTESVHRAFLEQVIEPLRQWIARSRQ